MQRTLNEGIWSAEFDASLAWRYNDQTRHKGSRWVREKRQDLDQFLIGVERSAFRMAVVATHHADDALDIVQETMIKLVEKYANKPTDEWRPLFYRILQSKIMDYHRKRTLTRRIFRWIDTDAEQQETEEAVESYGPPEYMAEQLTLQNLIAGLQDLSPRQQQAFLLRTWQGFNVAETAKIMKCSEGSVKTHLSRATSFLMRSIGCDENGETA